MKKTWIALLLHTFLLTGAAAFAQDSTKKSAAREISSSSEKTDQQLGKKIQQQSLFNNKFEKTGNVSAAVPSRKKQKAKRRHQ